MVKEDDGPILPYALLASSVLSLSSRGLTDLHATRREAGELVGREVREAAAAAVEHEAARDALAQQQHAWR